MLVAGDGRVVLAWIDKRDMEAAKRNEGRLSRYAAIYAAVSNDGGRSFAPERAGRPLLRVLSHCGRPDQDGSRCSCGVTSPTERTGSCAVRLNADGSPQRLERVTFDRWKIDGCPHHGPSLAVDGAGGCHAVWFNQKAGEGRVFYGHLSRAASRAKRIVGGARRTCRPGCGRAAALRWSGSEFDGEKICPVPNVRMMAGRRSARSIWRQRGLLPINRVLVRGDALFAFWRTEAKACGSSRSADRRGPTPRSMPFRVEPEGRGDDRFAGLISTVVSQGMLLMMQTGRLACPEKPSVSHVLELWPVVAHFHLDPAKSISIFRTSASPAMAKPRASAPESGVGRSLSRHGCPRGVRCCRASCPGRTRTAAARRQCAASATVPVVTGDPEHHQGKQNAPSIKSLRVARCGGGFRSAFWHLGVVWKSGSTCVGCVAAPWRRLMLPEF